MIRARLAWKNGTFDLLGDERKDEKKSSIGCSEFLK